MTKANLSILFNILLIILITFSLSNTVSGKEKEAPNQVVILESSGTVGEGVGDAIFGPFDVSAYSVIRVMVQWPFIQPPTTGDAGLIVDVASVAPLGTEYYLERMTILAEGTSAFYVDQVTGPALKVYISEGAGGGLVLPYNIMIIAGD